MAGHIQSASSLDWNTPPHVLEAVRWVFGGEIALDPCANASGLVHALTEMALPRVDGLLEPWAPYATVFVNPPYGASYKHKGTGAVLATKAYRQLPKSEQVQYTCSRIGDWVRKCRDSHRDHKTQVIALLPAAVDTRHWQDIIFRSAAAIFFPRGRLHFLNPNRTDNKRASGEVAPMACALVYWGSDPQLFIRAMELEIGGTALKPLTPLTPLL